MAAPKNKDWYAWEDQMPPIPPGPTLYVTGDVETPGSNIVPVLKPAVPQGTNPKILILDLTLVDTHMPGIPVVDFRPARYERDVEKGEFTQVEIRWETTSIELIAVQIVQ